MMIGLSVAEDEGRFREFWDRAVAAQEAAGLPLWPRYPAETIRAEMRSALHFSARDAEGRLTGYFSLALADPHIWGEAEKGDAVYIHRMCVNPAAKGRRFAGHVLAWACGYARGAGRRFVRMDTWRDNRRLVDYYVSCGFRRAGERRIGAVPELSPHYANLDLALFQNEL